MIWDRFLGANRPPSTIYGEVGEAGTAAEGEAREEATKGGAKGSESERSRQELSNECDSSRQELSNKHFVANNSVDTAPRHDDNAVIPSRIAASPRRKRAS